MSDFYKIIAEKLNYLEISPDNSVWKNIDKELRPEESKKPFWWFTSNERKIIGVGLMASIVLSSFLFTCISKVSSIDEATRVTQEIKFSTPKTNSTHLPTELVTSSHTATDFFENQKPVSSSLHRNHIHNSSKSLHPISELPSSKRNTISSDIEKIKDLSSQPKKSELIASLPIVESKDGSIKVYQNEEWIDLVPIQNAPLEPLMASTSTNTSVITAKLPDNTPVDISIKSDDVRLKSGFYFTPTLGANICQIYFHNPLNNSFFAQNTTFSGKFGYQGGFQLGYKFNKHWSLEGGMYYTQVQQSFNESNGNYKKIGLMYIDQIDFPMMARFSLHFGSASYPKSISFKSGLIYNSVLQYQVNYIDKDLVNNTEKTIKIDADKRLYNSLQMGYLAGIDFDAFLSRKISLNTSILSSLMSQLENFPFFRRDQNRPIQFNTTVAMGIKFHF